MKKQNLEKFIGIPYKFLGTDYTGLDCIGLLADYVQFAREEIFEEVRKKKFSTLPSRQVCLWVIPESIDLQENLIFWINKLTGNDSIYQILKLSCSGEIHYANQDYLTPHLGEFNKFRENAECYWCGTNVKVNSNNTECLFVGNV